MLDSRETWGTLTVAGLRILPSSINLSRSLRLYFSPFKRVASRRLAAGTPLLMLEFILDEQLDDFKLCLGPIIKDCDDLIAVK